MDSEERQSAVPIVDLSSLDASSAEDARLAETVRKSFHHVGFMIVTGHGVDPALIQSVFDVSQRFFQLPLEEKQRIDKRRSRHFRGWEAEGTEYTNSRPDIREQIDLWVEHPVRPIDVEPAYLKLLGPNQWPREDLIPGFRAALENWFEHAGNLSGRIMTLLAMGLGLSSDHFEKIFGDERVSFTKLIRYPATPAGQFGVNAHHDAGFLTVLAPGQTPGLEIEDPHGHWVPVPLVPGSLVINIGEMLQAMTGNYYVATPHRVVTHQERHSVGYFHGPSLDTPLAPLWLDAKFRTAVAASPRHSQAGYMAQQDETDAGISDMQSPRHPDTYGGQIWNYLARSYPENMRRHYPNARRPDSIQR